MFELDSMDRPHEYIFMDEAEFNLTKRRRDWKIIGQCGGNVIPCAAISNRRVLHVMMLSAFMLFLPRR